MVTTGERVAGVRGRVSLVVLLGLALATSSLAGCASNTGGTATPATTTSQNPPVSSTHGPAKAPAVSYPLDATKMMSQPCTALTSTDTSGLNIVNASSKPDSDSNGSQCSWAGDSGGTVSVGWVTTNMNGLSDLYAKSSTMAYWQPTTVSGYPAAFGDALSDGRAQGDCVLNTAVSDKLYFIAQFDTPQNASQSCTLAEQAATDVIKNLGGS